MKVTLEEKELPQFIHTEIVPILFDGIVIGLIGQLGAGKTTFSRELLRVLDTQHTVSSPSYVLQNIYETTKGQEISHWDLYRVADVPDEIYFDSYFLTLIEWADKMPDYSLHCDYSLLFERTTEDSKRSLLLTKHTSASTER